MKIISAFVLAALLVPSIAQADVPTEADLKSCIGDKKTWTPTVFAKLKGKMSPEAAAAVLPGADQVSKYGFVTIKADNCAGAAEYELYFMENKKTQARELSRATILFQADASADDTFYQSLVKVTSAKFGKIRKKDEVEKKLITWVNRKFKTAQVSKKPARSGDMLQLSVSL
jgi:hypothetical protein